MLPATHPAPRNNVILSTRSGYIALHIQRRPHLAFKPSKVASHSHRTIITRSGLTDLFALDFDGVLADSQHEVNSAGYETARRLWPHLFDSIDAAEEARVMRGMAATRPRLVWGYESCVMARMIREDARNVEAIVQGQWDGPEGLLEQTLTAWGVSGDDLREGFEGFRSERVQADPSAWQALSPLYPGIKEALQDCTQPYYIISSKRSDRLIRLLNGSLGVDLEEDSPRVFGGLIPPNEKKVEALRSILQRPIAQDPSITLHFVDDRFETIKAIASQPDLAKKWNLYLAEHGYNTSEELEEARAMKGVRVINLEELCELLRFGIIMKVDDGCQDTEEEALAAIYKKPGGGAK